MIFSCFDGREVPSEDIPTEDNIRDENSDRRQENENLNEKKSKYRSEESVYGKPDRKPAGTSTPNESVNDRQPEKEK